MKKMRIEIVRATKPGLSSMSLVSARAIKAALKKHYTTVLITNINNNYDLAALVSRHPDLVFMGMKFVPKNPALGQHDPDKIWLADYLDDYGIVYTGSTQAAHELELNKNLAKQKVIDAGLSTSRFYVARLNEPQSRENMPLSFPLFIKPTNRGGGVGIDNFSVVHNFEQLESKVLSLSLDLQSDSLVEEYLPGREFSVALLKDEHSAEFSVMPLELVAPQDKNGDRVLSAAVKSADTETYALVDDEVIKSRITDLAMSVFTTLGARDYGRIDIRLDAAGNPHFLEANLLPSLINGYGNFPKACSLNIDLYYEPMLLQIVRLALLRKLSQVEETVETLPAVASLVPVPKPA